MKAFNLLVFLFILTSSQTYGYIYNLSDAEYNQTKNRIILNFSFDDDLSKKEEDPFAVICQIECNTSNVSQNSDRDFVFNLYSIKINEIEITTFNRGLQKHEKLRGYIEISQSQKEHIWRFRGKLENGKEFMLNIWSKAACPTIRDLHGNAGVLD